MSCISHPLRLNAVPILHEQIKTHYDYISCECLQPRALGQFQFPAFSLLQELAVIAYQAFMYNLKDFVLEEPNMDGLTGPDFVIQHPELLGAVLDALTSLIHCFHITWHESVETICLFSFTQLLLKNPSLSPKVCDMLSATLCEFIISISQILMKCGMSIMPLLDTVTICTFFKFPNITVQ